MNIFRIGGILPALLTLLVMLHGCAGSHRADSSARFGDILKEYPATNEPLSLRRIAPPLSGPAVSRPEASDVSIIVHPAYAVYVDRELDEQYPAVKWRLMKEQFEREANYISEQARLGNIVVLILPAGSLSRGLGSSSYTAYLNKTTGGKASVFYLYSETIESGNLAAQDIATLCDFLQVVRAQRLLIGGGYIGRCQGELYGQIVKYCGATRIYIVPEISTISPADISDEEASDIFGSVMRRDYSPVKEIILTSTDGNIQLLSVPQVRE